MSFQLDPTTLRYFLAVLEDGSMAKAAVRQGISTPSISRRIAELESQLEIQLLERSNTGVRPTVAGLALMEDARKILTAITSAQIKLAEFRDGVRGEVCISANPSSVAGYLLQDVQVFSEHYPMVRITLDEQRSAQVVQAVINGQADIGISMSAKHASDLNIQLYRMISLVLVVPVTHHLACRDVVDFAEAADSSFIVHPNTSSVGAVVAEACRKRGFSIQWKVQATTQEGMRGLVELGMGVALMTEESAIPHAAQRAIRCIRLDNDWARLPTYICTRRHDTLSPAARLLLSQLQAHSQPAELQVQG